MPVVDHPDRLAGLAGEERGVEGDDRGIFLLATEPAAGLGLDDLGLRVGELERALQRLVDVVRALQRAVDCDPAILARHGDHRVVLDVELLLVADAVRPLEDEIGLGEADVQVAGRDLVVGEDVLADERIEDWRKLFRPDAHAASSRPQRFPVGGREQDQRLRVVLDLATDRDEHRLIVADEADDVVARNVVGGDDRDLRPVERRIELDGGEAGMGDRRTDRRPEPGAREDEVVGVLRGPGQLVRALAAERRRGPRSAEACLAGPNDKGVGGAPARCGRARGPAGRCPDRHAARVDPPWP